MARNKQLPIPGLEVARQPSLEEVFRPIVQLIASLQDRVLKLELEVSILKTQLKKHQPSQKTETYGPNCYFWSDDRCLGRPADTCPWSVKVGQWEWVCAYPWKEKDYA